MRTWAACRIVKSRRTNRARDGPATCPKLTVQERSSAEILYTIHISAQSSGCNPLITIAWHGLCFLFLQ